MTTPSAPQSPWQRIPAILVGIVHALGGIIGSGVLFANNNPAGGTTVGAYSLVAVLTSAVLASHMFAPATVQRLGLIVGLIDRFAPKVQEVLDALADTLGKSAPAAAAAPEQPSAVPPSYDNVPHAGLDPAPQPATMPTSGAEFIEKFSDPELIEKPYRLGGRFAKRP